MKQLVAAGVIRGGVHEARIVGRYGRTITPACIACEKALPVAGLCAECLRNMLSERRS